MSTSGGNEMSEMFVVMMAYLKMVQEEAREDRKIERMSNEIKLVAAEKKAELDLKKIDAQRVEAGEKADAAMAAAGAMSTSGGNEMSEMFVVMMAYLKMVQEEAREDRKIERMSNEIKLVAAEKKAELDLKKIDAQRVEAGEKADAAMEAAVTQLVTSCVSAAIQIASSSISIGGVGEGAKGRSDGMKGVITALGAVDSLVKGVGGYIAAEHKAEVNRIDENSVSKKLDKQAIQQEMVVKLLENDSSKDNDFADGSKAHRDRIRDAVLDLLRKMSEIKGLY